MKVYVASKYQERETIRELYDILRSHGHEITVDWTNHDVFPDDAEEEKLGEFACDDVRGVQECDSMIIYMVNEHQYKGAWVEMGVALALNKPVFVLGNAGDSCIFMNHSLVRKYICFVKLLEYLEYLEENNE